MSREAMSRDFVVVIQYAIESDWDDIWPPRLAGFPLKLSYAERIPGAGVACATYVFDPTTFVEGEQSRQMRYRPKVKTSRGLQKLRPQRGWFGCGRHPTRVRLFRGNGAGLGQGTVPRFERFELSEWGGVVRGWRYGADLTLNGQCTGPATSRPFMPSLMLTPIPRGTKDWQDRCR
jgi:hypothetical protein